MDLLSLYSGGGIADRGFRDAGFNLVGAVERDPKIAHYHNLNLGNHCLVASVGEVDYRPFRGIDAIFLSPPCRASSLANPNRGEDHPDWLLGAQAIVAIKTVKPRWIVMENVRNYSNNPAFKSICSTLSELNYFFYHRVLDCADLGVPQHRHRMILIAGRDFFLYPEFGEPRRGWWDAIADLYEECEDSFLADWQREILDRGGEVGARLLFPRAGASSGKKRPTPEDKPSPTVRSLEKGRHSHHFDAVTIGGNGVRSKKLSPRCLARLMSLPDDYILPDRKGLATTIVGNGFPTRAAYLIGSWILEQN